jgi:hypothetical protein
MSGRSVEGDALPPGRCFHMVDMPGALGGQTNCPEPVTTRGRSIDGSGKLRPAEACAIHATELAVTDIDGRLFVASFPRLAPYSRRAPRPRP